MSCAAARAVRSEANSKKVIGGEDIFSIDGFRARVQARLSFDLSPASRPGGDHALDDLPLDPAVVAKARLAAVLVPVVARAEEVTVLLTQRTTALRDHSGQVAFAGGKIDPGDASPIAAALREAREEVGLAADRVEPLAYLDPYLTRTNYRIVPVVAIVQPPFELTINAAEVDSAFEVPLRFLMQATNHQRREIEWQGQMRHFYAMPWGKRHIWGATAGILRNLYERLYG